MENPEEILQSLEEFAKLKPKDIPRELEDYLCFVAKTGDPIYQWSAVKSLFREKLLNVITDFYESCPSIDIPPCPNVDVFNYEVMKNFILEKLDTFAAAPFTVQRICELLTTPRKEYNRIDKYMRALEKNILVVSTTEPGNRRSTENGEGFVNGIENEHSIEMNSNNDINVEEMDDTTWTHVNETNSNNSCESTNSKLVVEPQISPTSESTSQEPFKNDKSPEKPCTSNTEPEENKTTDESLFVSIEPVVSSSSTCSKQVDAEPDVTVTITAIPAAVQKRRDSIEPEVSSETQSEPVTSSKDSAAEIMESEQPTTTVSDKPVDEVIETIEPTKIDEAPSSPTESSPSESSPSESLPSVSSQSANSPSTSSPSASNVVADESSDIIKVTDEQIGEIKKTDESTDTDESIEKNEALVAEETSVPVIEQILESEPMDIPTEIPQEVKSVIKDAITSTTSEEPEKIIEPSESNIDEAEPASEPEKEKEVTNEIVLEVVKSDEPIAQEEASTTEEIVGDVLKPETASKITPSECTEDKPTPMEVDSEDQSIISAPVEESECV